MESSLERIKGRLKACSVDTDGETKRWLEVAIDCVDNAIDELISEEDAEAEDEYKQNKDYYFTQVM